MSAKKPPAKKAPKKSIFQRVSDAMNPTTYLRPGAQRQMRELRETGGAEARRRQIEAITGDPSPPRRRRSR